MPLSDHEQRLLEQMERALYAEDPKFVSSLRGADLRRHYRRRTLQASLGFVLGLALLMAGVISTVWAVGALGFVLMLAAAVFGVTSYRRVAGGAEPAGPSGKLSGKVKRAARNPGPKRSVSERLEERWRRRRDGDGR